MKFKSALYTLLIAVAFSSITAGKVYADRPAKEELRETVPVRQEPVTAPQAIPAAASPCSARLSYGQVMWFFSDEDSTTAPGVYFDYWCADMPINFRVGVEGRHMDLSQDSVAGLEEAPGEAVEVTYMRIPFAAEYYTEIATDTTWYLGVGPEIINLANDVSDTAVGFHIGTRVNYMLTDSWGLALEGGYMWDELDGQNGNDVDLSGAYVTPYVNYTF